MSTKDYRSNHIAHHRHTNSEQDPDWVRKIPLPEWQFPQSKSAIAKTLFKQILIGGFQWVALMAKLSRNDWKKGLYWASVITAVTAFGVWQEFLLYWMVPLLALFPLIQRIRSISEHFGLPREHELNHTRNILAGPVERFLIGPHNINYHLAHHLFPSIPHYKVKDLHKGLMKHPVYAECSHTNDSYFTAKKSVWVDLQTVSGADGVAEMKAG